MSKELSRDEFAALPLAAQVKTLDRELKRGEPRHLLKLSASLRDHAPLAYLSAKLLANKWLGEPENRDWFARFLVKEEETAVDKVIKALAEKAREVLLAKKRSADTLHEHLCYTIVKALQVVPISHLSSLCLLDRALKHNFPEARIKHVANTRKLCIDALKRGDLEPVTIDRLAHVRAEAIPELRKAAKGAGVLKEFDERRKELAHRTIDVIGNAPKAVSQANAEELLAKRVYTDPGHFLIELLQNAEDSGAKTWKLIFDAGRIVVWHDGTDFDARDVVGVCSIGQTTKRKDQIGFFGVGFKSVYEVTNRPQIYSDVYQFEIADVSIPKVLRQRPKDLPEGGTLLVLPLVNADDPVRSPKAMFKKAQAIDPYVLMTLKSIDVLDFTLTKAAGGPVEHVLTEIHFKDRRQRVIEKKGDNKQHYLLEHDILNWEGPPRPAGRTDKTELMVGLTTDPDLKPEWNDNPTTVFSHLPTGEKTGLRFLIQAHFEVPVDRERVDHDSKWNAWIMRHVPEQLARLADAVLEGPDPMGGARRFLEVLPLASELVAPIYTQMADSLAKVMRERALIPCTDGNLHTPVTALIADKQICKLFEGTSIDGSLINGSNQTFSFVDPNLDDRCLEVCRSMGCKPFEGTDLVKLLEQAVNTTADKMPIFLAESNAARFSQLAQCLLKAVEDNNRVLKRLRSLEIIPDTNGELHSVNDPMSAPARGKDSLRKIYDGFRPFIIRELDALSGGKKPAGQVTLFLDRLGTPKLTQAELLDDLESVLKPQGSQMESIDATAFPGTRERLNLILIEFANSPPELQLRARALPIFPATNGTFCRGARDSQDRHGIVHTRNVRHAKNIRMFYDGVRPLLEKSIETGAAGRLLAATNVPPLDLDLLTNDLENKLFELDPERIVQLHQLLETACDSVDSNTRDIFCLLSIWPDQNDKPWPLVGEEVVCLPSSKAIRQLLPDVPMLDETIAAMAHVKDLSIDPVGIDQIIHALAADAKPPFAIPHERDRILEVQEYLLTSGEKLSSHEREALAELPVFLDDTQTPRTLSNLMQTDDDRLRQLYVGTELNAFLEEQSSSMKLVEVLGLESRITKCLPETLISDIALGVKTDGFSVLTNEPKKSNEILHYLSDQSGQIPAHAIEMLMELPLFPDEKGKLGVMKSSQSSADKKGMYAILPELRRVVSDIGYPLLNTEIQEAVTPLLRRANISTVKLRTAVELLELKSKKKAAITDSVILKELHVFFIEEKKELRKHFPAQVRLGLSDGNPRLCSLKIWPTLTGGIISADEAVDPGPLLELLEKGTVEFEELQKRVLTPEATDQLRKLSPMLSLCPAWRMAGEFITRFAKIGKPLTQQPRFISTPENLRRVAELIAQQKDITLADLDKLPVCDAAGYLQYGLLAMADEETHALVSELPVFSKLVHPHFNDFTLEEHGEVFKPVETVQILNAVLVNTETFHANGDQRLRFYNWLVTHEHKVMSQEACRQLIETQPCFMNAGGKLVVPGNLVVDPDLPDLGIDWAPHPDIPKEVLSLLTRQLKIGKPAIEMLIKSHIRAAYDKAVEAKDSARTKELLVYLSKQLGSRSPKEVQELLPDLMLEDAKGKFRPATELLQPLAGIQDYVKKIWSGEHPQPSEAYPQASRDFLIALGVHTMPSVDQIRDVFDLGVTSLDMSVGLAGLVNDLHREGNDLSGLPLKEQPWIVDGKDKARRPRELFDWTMQVNALLGDGPDLYAYSQIRTILRPKLREELGFKQLEDVRLEDVLGRIKVAVKSGERVPFQVYKWMEQGLNKGWFNADDLTRKLKGKNWIFTDNDTFFSASKVLGTRAVDYFGNRRGYWRKGVKDCPELCAVFGIPTEVTNQMVQNFLKEVSKDISKTSDLKVIAGEPAIPQMLLNCAAHLGKNGVTVSKNLQVFVSKQCGGKDAKSQRMLAASDALLFRSETPTLEGLFSKAGTFYLTETGRAAKREEVIAFYDAMKIRRLRDSYTAVVDSKSGRDTTNSSGGRLQGLKSVLHALAMVMPRVEKNRDHLDQDGWVYRKRLKPLGEAGAIRVIQDLQVQMNLKGVGSVSDDMTARFDPKENTLLIEEAVLDNPRAYSSGLAEGLIPCIFEGNGEDGLVEIVELLLTRSNLREMNNYLDKRHFPMVEMNESAGDRMLRRLSEVLNYSSYENLRSHFESLKNCDFDKWRDDRLHKKIAQISSKDLDFATAKVARLLLQTLGVTNAEEQLVKVLADTFKADSINGVPIELQQTASKPDPQDNVELGEINRKSTEPEEPEPPGDGGQPKEPRSERSWDAEPVIVPPPEPVVKEGGGFEFFNTVKNWFRNDNSDLYEGGCSGANDSKVEVPSWMEGNNLAPVDSIRSQLGFSGHSSDAPDRFEDTAPAGFYFDPTPLPPPFHYGVQEYGVTFNAANQEWTDKDLPKLKHLDQLSPSAHTVSFKGFLSPGHSQLPIPMLGRIQEKPKALNGKNNRLGVLESRPDGGYEINIKGGSRVEVEYQVQLPTVPDLGVGSMGKQKLASALIQPTMAWNDLPDEVQRWIVSQRQNNLTDSEQARAVEKFVQIRYCYDKYFNDKPEAKHCRVRLKRGRGNHHLELLHACGDERYLGRGVCFELNSMVVEILRHLGQPAAVATGWVFEGPNVTDPQHLFAVAFVQSIYGLCPLPLEAATGEGGREMQFSKSENLNTYDIDRGAADIPEPAGAWTAPVRHNTSQDVDIQEDISSMRRRELDDLKKKSAVLHMAIELVCDKMGGSTPRNLSHLRSRPTKELYRDIREKLEELLKDDQMAANLLGLLRGEFKNVPRLPKAIHRLEDLGLVSIQEVSYYNVSPNKAGKSTGRKSKR